jgi:hypothetical protein
MAGSRWDYYQVEDVASGLPLAIGTGDEKPAARPATPGKASRFVSRAAALMALDRAGLGTEALEVVRVAAT